MEGLKKIDFKELIDIITTSDKNSVEELELFFALNDDAFFRIQEIYLYPRRATVRNYFYDEELEINEKKANIFKKVLAF